MGSDQQHPLALTAPAVCTKGAASVSAMGLVSLHTQLHQLCQWEKPLPLLLSTAQAFLKRLSPEREQADKEICSGEIRPGSGSLRAARHPHTGRLSAGGLTPRGGEGLALWGTSGLEEAAKDSSSSYLSPGLSCKRNGPEGKKGAEGDGAGVFLLGKPLGLFHQREGSPRHRAAGFHEPLAANPGPHGAVYPGTGEPINHSPEMAGGGRLSSRLQHQQRGCDSLPRAGSGPLPGHGCPGHSCQAQPVPGHRSAGLRGRHPHP